MTIERRDVFFVVSVCLFLLIAVVTMSRLPATLPRVYIHARDGYAVFDGKPGPDKILLCLGLPHQGNGGLVFCQGELFYHPWAYSVPINDRDLLKEVQAEKQVARNRAQ